MEFLLQISDFKWLMSGINRKGKDRYREGNEEEEVVFLL